MRIRLLTIAQKPPAWIQTGYQEYTKRLPSWCMLDLIEIAPEKHRGQSHSANMREGEKMLTAIRPGHDVIALDVRGKLLSTEEFALQLTEWQHTGKNIDFLIGGADGLTAQCLERSNAKWSLSRLTFPHMLVRIIFAEQLYRACSILQNHPYHR